jgi:hypothetical protein
MSEDDFVTFERFIDPAFADEVAAELKRQQIPFRLEDNTAQVDPFVPAGNVLITDIRIKLRRASFAEADAILNRIYEQQFDNLPEDYYLFEFSDDELMDILRTPDEWGRLDYLLARSLLNQRGHHLEKEEVAQLKKERIKELARPEKTDRQALFLGYVAAFAFSPLGIFLGWTMANAKKTLPDGRVVFARNERERAHGESIFILSIVVLVVSAALGALRLFMVPTVGI